MTSIPVRTGVYSRAPGVDSDVCGHAAEPEIWAHVYRLRLRHAWRISAGRGGLTLDWGRTWTRGGAMVAAIAAAHRPDGRRGR